MTRERISRPSSSVPNQWWPEGRKSRAESSIRAGSCGAIQGAKRAKMTKMEMRMTPAVARGLRRDWRLACATSCVVDAIKGFTTKGTRAHKGKPRATSCSFVSFVVENSRPHPRVHHRIQHVSQEIHGNVSDANRQDAALNQVIVT